jgi:hypothetical protein
MFDYFGNQLDPSLYYARTGKYFSDFNLTALQISSGQQITLRGQEQYFAIMRLMSTQTGLSASRSTHPHRRGTSTTA